MRGHSAQRYQVAFNNAVRNGNYETAHLFLQKLQTLPTQQLDKVELGFNDALTKFARGHVDDAIEQMEQLAPPDGVGYAPAHRWLAQLQMSKDPSLAGPNRESVIHHLKAAVARDPRDIPTQLALGNCYYRTGNPAKAVKHLQVAAESHPELHFVLANLYDSLSESKSANDQYEQAAEVLAAELAKDPAAEELRVNLAIAQYKLGQFPKAVQTITEGLDASTPSPKLVNLLSTLYLNESDRLRNGAKPDDPDFANSLMLLSQALELAPDNQAAINRIALIGSYEGETAKRAIETLKQLIASGKMTATAHVILGTAALNRGDTERAKLHYSSAYRLNSRMPALLNNVAWMMMRQEPPQLEPALTVVQQAIEQTPPESPIFAHMVETRGQIYRRMKRWNDALADLETALKQFPNDSELHRSLAAVYRALGDETMALEHEKRSQ